MVAGGGPGYSPGLNIYRTRASKTRRLDELEHAAAGMLVSFRMKDGTLYHVKPKAALKEAMGNWMERLGADLEGRPDPGPSPVVAALVDAAPGELRRLIESEGLPSLFQMYVREHARFTNQDYEGM